MNNIEILAPAGDEQSFFAAINNGANAIYMGLQNFNARNKAANFNLETLTNFVNIAHLYNVKIYLVVNTLINNEEIPELLTLVTGAVNAKVDAFIVQDLGIAKLLKNTFKNIVLHASTQTGIHSLQGAIIAEKLGFTRIVLSREVTKQDIIQIKQNTNLEIEYFVHGALCVSFSGNCYLSSLMSNESGNRGRCLQPCRLCYSSKSENTLLKKGYLLSANDLCLIDKINELSECGVTSFKIEGRLRRPSYVAYVTQAYSSAISGNAQINANNAQIRVLNFKKLFNRGSFNTGFYLQGEPNKNTINPLYQNHRGIEIGVVKNVKPFKEIYEVLIKTNGYKINKNDGLKFVFNNNEQSLGVGSVKQTLNKNEYVVHTKTNPKINSQIYLTVDSEWEESLLNNKKKIEFNATFTALQNKPAILTLSVGEVAVSASTENTLDLAQKQGLTKEEVLENLQKTKDTFFTLKSLNCNIENVFMPKSILNELRRMALNKLQQELINNYQQKNIVPITKINFNYEQVKVNFEPKKVITLNEQSNLDYAQKLFTPQTLITFSPSVYSLKNIQTNFEKLKQKFNVSKIYLNLPKVLRYKDYILVEQIINNFSKQEIGIIANNIGHLTFALNGYEVIGGVYLNIANNLAASVLNDFNIKTFTKSFESFASSMNVGLTYVGTPDVMTFCHCPYKTNFENEECSNCKFNNKLSITSQSEKTYFIHRTKIDSCVFTLANHAKINADKEQLNNVFINLK